MRHNHTPNPLIWNSRLACKQRPKSLRKKKSHFKYEYMRRVNCWLCQHPTQENKLVKYRFTDQLLEGFNRPLSTLPVVQIRFAPMSVLPKEKDTGMLFMSMTKFNGRWLCD